jgi:hypothetical protein
MKNNLLFLSLLLVSVYLVQCSPKARKQLQTSVPTPPVPAAPLIVETTVPSDQQNIRLEAATLNDEGEQVNKPADLVGEPLMEMEESTGIDVGHGKKIWLKSCGKCHELYPPNSRSAEEWRDVVETMSEKAQLSPDDKMEVTAFLRVNAKQ